LHRFNSLWLWGASKLGKTEWIRQYLPGAHWCEGTVTWKGYDPNTHTGVVFDDIKDICSIIVANKKLFQASGTIQWGTSQTNCYAIDVDVLAKPLVVLANFAPNNDGWIAKNFKVVHITEPMWTQ